MIYKRVSKDGDFTLFSSEKKYCKTPFELIAAESSSEDFIEALRATTYYQEMLAVDDILGIYLVGSRAIGAEDEYSDYDLVILTTSGEFKNVSEEHYLKFQGHKVHWIIRSLDNALNFFDLAGNCVKKYWKPIYSTSSIELDNFFNEPLEKDVQALYEQCEAYIEAILEAEEITEEFYSKKLYHLCIAYYVLFDKEFDLDFLRSIKRIRYQPVSDIYKVLAFEYLKKLKEYFRR